MVIEIKEIKEQADKLKNAGRMIVGWDQSPECCATGKVVMLVASEPDVDTRSCHLLMRKTRRHFWAKLAESATTNREGQKETQKVSDDPPYELPVLITPPRPEAC